MADLSKKQIDLLKQRLNDLRSELDGMLDHSWESSKPVGLDQPIGRLSRMDAMQQQNMTQASRRSAELRLAQIDNALSRIKRDSYGYCMECEENIEFARLQAQPESPFCFICQSRKEQR